MTCLTSFNYVRMINIFQIVKGQWTDRCYCFCLSLGSEQRISISSIGTFRYLQWTFDEWIVNDDVDHWTIITNRKWNDHWTSHCIGRSFESVSFDHFNAIVNENPIIIYHHISTACAYLDWHVMVLSTSRLSVSFCRTVHWRTRIHVNIRYMNILTGRNRIFFLRQALPMTCNTIDIRDAARLSIETNKMNTCLSLVSNTLPSMCFVRTRTRRMCPVRTTYQCVKRKKRKFATTLEDDICYMVEYYPLLRFFSRYIW
jgi:hypothetical protein